MELYRLLIDTALLTPGWYDDEPSQAAGRIYRTIKLGLSIGADKGLGFDNDEEKKELEVLSRRRLRPASAYDVMNEL